ncbi:MAG: response regulator [Pseudomonadota bacterium]
MISSPRTLHVLIVDDEQNLREGARRILIREGHQVSLASRGREALSLMAQNRADIVLLDLKMPGIGGMEVLDSLRETYPDVLVIIITGFATIETAIEAMKKGAYDFMTKPFRPDQLRLGVGRAVEHIRLREELDRLSEERARGLWAISTETSRLKTVVNSIMSGLLITQRNKTIILCNPAFTKMTGLGKEIIGAKTSDHPALSQLNVMIDDFASGPDSGREQISREYMVDGSPPKYYTAAVNRVLTESGKMLGLVVVLRDVTHVKEQEKEKSAFMAMLTHELRAPLSSLDTQFHVILKGLAGQLSDKQRDMLSRMKKRVRGVLAMINDLLDLSKIEARQFVKDKIPVDLGALAKEAADLMSDQAGEKSITLETSLDRDLPPVLGDPSALMNVAVNLASNAIKYTPAQGRIKITATRDGSMAVFSVEDNGLGVPEEYQAKIFERFFRVKDERARDVIGAGLGLAIVKAIVEDHGGRITLCSAVGRGSCFRVELPLSRW